MWIVNLEVNPNGSHNSHRAEHITSVPDGWAMIPDGFSIPHTFPFVSIEAKEGVVTGMAEGTVPDVPEPEPTKMDVLEAQVTYTAMMTDTLLEV